MKFYRRYHHWHWFWLLFLVAFFGFIVILSFSQLSNEIEIITHLRSLDKSQRPDSAFFFNVGKLIESQYYYTSPAPMESLPIFWQRTKLKIEKNPEKNDSLVFAGLSQFCNLFADGYTYFLNPAQTRALSKKNQFIGIGIQLAEIDSNQKEIKFLRILKVFPNSPAEKAGLKPGDFILAVNHRSIKKFKSVAEITETIRGQEGITVKLTIWRPDWDKPKVISLTRVKIFIKSVNWRMIENFAYLELNDFSALAEEELDKVVSEIVKNKPAAIILDLRDNLGGTLKSVKRILSYWICGVSYKLQTQTGCRAYRAYRSGSILLKPKLKKIRTVILINQKTASASELLIGALKDYNLATLIGEKTYGKGCYQNFILLPFGTSLGVTKGLWLTPKGQHIDKKGFLPDIEIKFDQDLWLNRGVDNQLEKAIEILKNK